MQVSEKVLASSDQKFNNSTCLHVTIVTISGPVDFRGVPEWPKGADCKSVSTAFDGSNPSPSTNMCGSGSGVEHRLAKARVASSNLVFRSTFADVVQW